MPTALPPAVNFTGASVTEGQFKTAITDLREHVNEMSTLRSLAGTGYMKFSSGLIIQWGLTTAASAGTATTFPIAFPTSVAAIVTGISNSSATVVRAYTYTLTGFTFQGDGGSHAWVAIGY